MRSLKTKILTLRSALRRMSKSRRCAARFTRDSPEQQDCITRGAYRAGDRRQVAGRIARVLDRGQEDQQQRLQLGDKFTLLRTGVDRTSSRNSWGDSALRHVVPTES